MTQERINRINELARKSRTEKLTDEELKEQKELRDEYRKSIIRSLTGDLENITLVSEDGKKERVKDRKKN